MYFIYTENNIEKKGDISIIPYIYKNFALQQKSNTIIANNKNYYCPPLIVGISKSIQYII